MTTAYNPGDIHIYTHMIKVKNHVGLKSIYSGASKYQIRKEYPNIQFISFDEAMKEIEAVEEFELCKQPQRISSEEYNEALEVLPPADWKSTENGTYFHISEMYTTNISYCYFKVKIRTRSFYYSCRNRVYRKKELLEYCNKLAIKEYDRKFK